MQRESDKYNSPKETAFVIHLQGLPVQDLFMKSENKNNFALSLPAKGEGIAEKFAQGQIWQKIFGYRVSYIGTRSRDD